MYVPFLLAEIMHLSGIVTILFTGMAARQYVVPNLSSATESNSDTFFRLVAHIAETSIFLELGLSVFGLAGGNLYWRFVLWSFFACLLGRVFNIYPIAFFFNQSLRRAESEITDDPYVVHVEMKVSDQDMDESAEYENVWSPNETLTPVRRRDLKISMKAAHMLWFSGLRGAVAYACVRSFPDTFGHKTPFIVTTMIIVLVSHKEHVSSFVRNNARLSL
jgi:sodium/hydrogen exchanger 8